MLNDFTDFADKQYDSVGYCIYCGSMNKLSDEHIIPYGLSGTVVLPKSTCKECAEITGKQELEVLRKYMQQVRAYLPTKSRSKHKMAPSEYELGVMRGEVEELEQFPLNEYPIKLPFPLFSPPAFLNSYEYTNGIRMEGMVHVSFGGPKAVEIISKLGATGISQTYDLKPVSFARVIAKIAYALAFAEGILDKINGNPLVLPAILGETDDIGCWVGTFTDPMCVFDSQLHRIRIYGDHQKGLLMGDVQLFSNFYTPRYEVIIGMLR